SFQMPMQYRMQYLGGMGDGHHSFQMPMQYRMQYLGGMGDGHHSFQMPMKYLTQYLGGMGDGHHSAKTPFPLYAQYLGGMADGFHALIAEGLFSPLFTGGISDGFAKRTVPCDTFKLHIYADSLVCPKDTLFLRTDTIPGATYTWRGPGAWTSTEQNPIRLQFSQAMVGTYEVVAYTGCPGDDDSWPTAMKQIGAMIALPIGGVIDSISPSNEVCEGTPVTFGVRHGYGWGTNPFFVWNVNGNPLPGVANDSTVVIDSLYNNHKVSVSIYSSEVCVTDRPFVTGAIRMKVDLNESVNIKMASNVSKSETEITICQNLPVTFNFTIVNGGTDPTYQWMRNSDTISGEHGLSYSCDSLREGDTIWVRLFSSLPCVDCKPKESNRIAVHVIPSGAMTHSDDKYILPGESADLWCAGGTDQSLYTWRPTGSMIYTSVRHDSVNVSPTTPTKYTMTIIEPWGCKLEDTVWVYVVSHPRIVKHSGGTTVCEHDSASFSITALGINLQYQWQVNTGSGAWTNVINSDFGFPTPYTGATSSRLTIGSNAGQYFAVDKLTQNMEGYKYRCRVVSIVPQTFTDDTIYSNTPEKIYGNAVLHVNSLDTAKGIIVATPNQALCENTSTIFNLSTQNTLGSNYTIAWIVNGVEKQKSPSKTYTHKAHDGDTVHALIYTDLRCPAYKPEATNKIAKEVYTLPLVDAGSNVTIQYNKDTILEGTAIPRYGSALTYQWKPADKSAGILTTLRDTTIKLQLPQWYYLHVTEAMHGCTNYDSVRVNIQGGPLGIDANQGFSVCERDTLSIQASPYGGSGNYKYTWSSTPSIVGLPTNTTTENFKIVAPVGNTTIKVSVGDGKETVTKTISINVAQRKLSTVKVIGDSVACDGEKYQFSVKTDPYTGNNPSYQWFVNNRGVYAAFNQSFGPIALDSGALVYCLVLPSYGCPSKDSVYTDTIHTHLYPKPVYIEKSVDTSLCEGIPYNLFIRTAGAVNFQWTPTDGLSNASIANPIATPATTTAYKVIASTAKGCSITERIVLTILPTTSIQIRYSQVDVCLNGNVSVLTTHKGHNLTYAWQKYDVGTGQWFTLSESAKYGNTQGDALLIRSVPKAEEGDQYRVIAMGSCLNDTSLPASLRVIEQVDFHISSRLPQMCYGDTITFYASTNVSSIVNMYEWRINGVTYGYSHEYGYTYRLPYLKLNNLKEGDRIQCFMHVIAGAASCVTANPLPSQVITVTIRPVPVFAIEPIHPTACGSNDGKFTVKVTNGTSPYQYSYDGGKTFVATNVKNNLVSGYYTANVKDADGCIGNIQGISLRDPNSPIAPVVEHVGLYCQDAIPAYLTISSATKKQNTTIKWFAEPACTTLLHTGDSLPVIQTYGYQNYYVYQEKLACKSATVKATVFVSRKPVIQKPIAFTNPTSCELADGEILIHASGDTTLYYSISSPSNYVFSNDFFNLSAAKYPISVKDEAGCEVFSDTLKLVAPNTPAAPTMNSNDIVYCKTDTKAPLSATAKEGGTLSWFDDITLKHLVGTGTTLNISSLQPGKYIFSVVEKVQACISEASEVKVTVAGDLDLGLPTDTIGCAGGSMELSARFIPGASYLWSTGATSNSIVVVVSSTPTVYTLTVYSPTEGKICPTVVKVRVSENTVPIRIDTNVCEGSTLSLSVPNGVSFLWQDGSTDAIKTVIPNSAIQQYHVWVTFHDGCRKEYIFNVRTKEVDTLKVVLTKNFTAYCLPGSNYELKALLNNNTIPVSYQWSQDGVEVVGATDKHLIIDGLTPSNYQYRVKVKATTNCIYPEEVQSLPIKIKVSNSPVVYAGADVSNHPYLEKLNIGSDATVKEGSPGYNTYLWQGSFIPTGKENDLIFTTGRLSASSKYSLTVTDTNGCKGSDTLMVTVIGGPFEITSITVPNDTICLGDTTSLEAIASGGSGNYEYVWKSVPVDANISIHDNPIQVHPRKRTTYTVTVINKTGNPADALASDTLSYSITIGVDSLAIPGYITPLDTTLCRDSISSAFLRGYKGDRIYWENSSNGIDWSNTLGHQDTCVVAGSRRDSYYRAAVSNGVCPKVYGDSVHIRVYQDLDNIIIGTATVLCPEVEGVVITGNTMTEGGNGTYTYSWEYSRKGESGPFTLCPPINNDTSYTWVDRIDSTTYFRRIIYSDACPFISNVQKAEVYIDSKIGEITGENYVCIDSVTVLKLSNQAMTNYVWQYALDTAIPLVWQSISNSSLANYTIDAVVDTIYYRAFGSKNGCDADTTLAFVIYPTKPLQVEVKISADTTEVCLGSPIQFTAITKYGGNKPNLKWFINGQHLLSDTTGKADTIILSNLADGDTVTLQLASSIGCVTERIVESNKIGVSIHTPAIQATPSDTVICMGDTISITASGALDYLWNFGSTDSTVRLTATDTTLFTVQGSDRFHCFGIDTIRIIPDPIVVKLPDTNVCEGALLGLYARTQSIGATYYWTETKLDPSAPNTLLVNTTYRPKARPVDSITYYIFDVKSHGGQCHYVDSIKVTVEKVTTPTLHIDYNGVRIGDTVIIVECDKVVHLFKAISTETGQNPQYIWSLNADSVSFVDSIVDTGFVHNARLFVQMTTSKQCVTARTIKSEEILVKMNYMPEAKVSINSNKGLYVCEYDTVTVYKTHAPSYDTAGTFEWFTRRDTATTFTKVGNDTSYRSFFKEGDQIYIVYTAGDSCIKKSPVKSNILTFHNYPTVHPNIVIDRVGPTNNVCEFTDVSFHATLTDPGSNAQIIWYKGGNEIGRGVDFLYYGDPSKNQDHDAFQAVSDTSSNRYDIIVKMVTDHHCAIPSAIVSDDTLIWVRPKQTLWAEIDMNPDPILCNSITEDSIEWEYTANINAGTGYANGAAYDWNAGGISRQRIHDNGSVSADVINIDAHQMFGLSANNIQNVWYGSIEYAIYLNYGTLNIYESGNSIGAFGSYNAGDHFKVEVADSVVYYLKNDSVFYISPKKATQYPLFADFSFYGSYGRPGLNQIKVEYRATTVTFNGHPHFQGSAPVYQWYVNGEKDGISDTIFTNPYRLFREGDTVNMLVKSSHDCLYAQEAYSNTIRLNHPDANKFLSNSGDTVVCFGDSVMLHAYGAQSYEWDLLKEGFSTDSTPLVSPLVTSYYKVMGANINGCKHFQRLKVEVLPLPEPKTGPDYAICLGDSVCITANYGRRALDVYTYSWTSTDGKFTALTDSVKLAPDTTRTYIVSMNTSRGCSASDTLTITVNYLPQVY
ncbi:MAG: hypothetical protein RR393_07875, partial [Bacteroidales bacterium]